MLQIEYHKRSLGATSRRSPFMWGRCISDPFIRLYVVAHMRFSAAGIEPCAILVTNPIWSQSEWHRFGAGVLDPSTPLIQSDWQWVHLQSGALLKGINRQTWEIGNQTKHPTIYIISILTTAPPPSTQWKRNKKLKEMWSSILHIYSVHIYYYYLLSLDIF